MCDKIITMMRVVVFLLLTVALSDAAGHVSTMTDSRERVIPPPPQHNPVIYTQWVTLSEVYNSVLIRNKLQPYNPPAVLRILDMYFLRIVLFMNIY